MCVCDTQCWIEAPAFISKYHNNVGLERRRDQNVGKDDNYIKGRERKQKQNLRKEEKENRNRRDTLYIYPRVFFCFLPNFLSPLIERLACAVPVYPLSTTEPSS